MKNHPKKGMPVLTLALFMIITVTILFSTTGCDNRENAANAFTYKQIGALEVPADFDYRTSVLVNLFVNLSDLYPGVTLEVYGTMDTKEPVEPHNQDTLVGSATTDVNGTSTISVSVPTRYTHIAIRPSYIGLPTVLYAPIQDGTARFSLGQPITTLSRSMSVSSYPPIRELRPYVKEGLTYIDTFDKNGRPTNMVSRPLGSDFLADINASLPEYRSVPQHNPAYLEKGKDATINIIDKEADVWVTFVHEGASYLNSLGFYTYPSADGPPVDINDLDITIIIPNASLGPAGGGSMYPGDTVYIGRYAEGTSIGWVLYAYGWDSTLQAVRDRFGRYFSDYQYNREVKDSEKIHAVVLYDDERQVLVTGFEDVQRTNGGSDNDFNDLVFYALVNPVESVGNLDSFSEIKRAIDTDKDGVIDSEDYFPNDPRYSSFSEQVGTIAFEDMWPKLGDYDFNDLVVRYTYGIYGNTENLVPRIDFAYTILATGAGYRNGLALSLPMRSSEFSLKQIGEAPKGGGLLVEDFGAMQFANISWDPGVRIIIFNDAKRVLDPSAEAMAEVLLNTNLSFTEVPPVTVAFSLEFVQPIERTTLGAVPFDVFLLADTSNGTSHEIHLNDRPPTPLIYLGLLYDQEDGSYGSQGRFFRFYSTKNNLPWAIHVPGEWIHPLERVPIVDSYRVFGAWAESGGVLQSDWYMDKKNYLVKDNLYIR
jgi:LruC domain-containing protein